MNCLTRRLQVTYMTTLDPPPPHTPSLSGPLLSSSQFAVILFQLAQKTPSGRVRSVRAGVSGESLTLVFFTSC